MTHRQPLAAAVAAAIAIGSLAASRPALAQDSDQAADVEAIQVVGSRRVDRTDTDTPVPVDIIPLRQAVEQGGQFDLAQTLHNTSPSFNSTRQTGADGADLIDGAALRGLGSDQTLVLVNGKRRHTVALTNLFGARDRGNTGTDFNAIPMMAVERVEVLRDGAAAQYGSDAIAGVINVVLKRNLGCQSVFGYGEYTRGDGENTLATAYCGWEIGEGGVLGITGEWADRDRSNRATADNPTRIIGDSQVRNETLWLNFDQEVGETGHVYANAGFQSRDASSAAFARGGIGSGDIPSRNSAAMYPDGFVPFINGIVDDRAFSVGARWRLGEWNIDLSHSYGGNRLRYDISNTLNASIANLDLLLGGAGISDDHFYAGTLSFDQNTTNLDFSRYFPDAANGVNFAFGLEARQEQYRIEAGEPGSYVDADGVGFGGNAGSQGFPGFQPADEVDADRDSLSLYADLEVGFTDAVDGAFALRYENYSDFGSTIDGKAALAVRASDQLTFRGSASTGFRAPSLQQKYFSSTFTDFISGMPLDVVLAPNGGFLANAAGIPELTEETSTSFTLGFTWRPSDNTSLTLDAYRIDIDDRVVLSGRFDTTDPNIGAILLGLGVGQAQFFVNSVDTRTQGIDITFSHETEVWGGRLNSFLAANFGSTEVTAIHAPPALVGREDVLLSDRERLFIEEGAPGRKATLGFDFSTGRWTTLFKIIHFGPQTLGTFSGPPVPNQQYGSATSADLSFTYRASDDLSFTVGGTNIFDVFPDRQDPFETDNGHIYESVQFGLNGAAWFARMAYRF
jgi:iron complex outermembrane receptor protein